MANGIENTVSSWFDRMRNILFGRNSAVSSTIAVARRVWMRSIQPSPCINEESQGSRISADLKPKITRQIFMPRSVVAITSSILKTSQLTTFPLTLPCMRSSSSRSLLEARKAISIPEKKAISRSIIPIRTQVDIVFILFRLLCL